MSFLNRVCTALARHRVRYAIVGGHAVALHGAVRGTVYIDIALAWNLESLKAAEQALNEIGLVSRLPIGADEVFQFRDEYIWNRNLIRWNFYNPTDLTEQFDIVITYDLTGKNIATIQTAAGPLQVLGRDDLIEMKQAGGRKQDIEDARALENLK